MKPERSVPEAASNEPATYRVTVEATVERQDRKPRTRPMVAVFYGLLWLVVFLALLIAGSPQGRNNIRSAR